MITVVLFLLPLSSLCVLSVVVWVVSLCCVLCLSVCRGALCSSIVLRLHIQINYCFVDMPSLIDMHVRYQLSVVDDKLNLLERKVSLIEAQVRKKFLIVPQHIF